jgi:hypothetical protein
MTERGLPLQVCPAQAITIEAEEREDGARRTTRQAISLKLEPVSHRMDRVPCNELGSWSWKGTI